MIRRTSEIRMHRMFTIVLAAHAIGLPAMIVLQAWGIR